MVALSLLSLFLATTTLAAPSQREVVIRGVCPVPASAFTLPPTMSPIQSPPRFNAIGLGKQNYTCNSTGAYASIGAVAQIFDISCLYGTQEFSTIQNDAFDIWSECQGTDPMEQGLTQRFKKLWKINSLGVHYFVKYNGTLTPTFDFTSSQGDPNDIFYGKKIGDVPSPDGSDNVDWLVLQNVLGKLTNTVYRIDTVKGLPPATCQPGSPDISVKYAAKYLFI